MSSSYKPLLYRLITFPFMVLLIVFCGPLPLRSTAPRSSDIFYPVHSNSRRAHRLPRPRTSPHLAGRTSNSVQHVPILLPSSSHLQRVTHSRLYLRFSLVLNMRVHSLPHISARRARRRHISQSVSRKSCARVWSCGFPNGTCL